MPYLYTVSWKDRVPFLFLKSFLNPPSAGFFVMAERIITRVPTLENTIEFAVIYEQWRNSLGLNGETIGEIAPKLVREIDELSEVIKEDDGVNPSGMHLDRRLEIACEAADVFTLSVAACQSNGVSLDRVLNNNGQRISNFSELQELAQKLITVSDLKLDENLVQDLNHHRAVLAVQAVNTPTDGRVVSHALEMLKLSTVVITLLDLPIADVLTAKLHRNAFKYRPNGDKMHTQRDTWNGDLDTQFLKLQLGFITEVVL